MRKLISVLFALSILMSMISGCGNADSPSSVEGTQPAATDGEASEPSDTLTVLLCGPQMQSVEAAIKIFNREHETEINVVKYEADSEWEKFSTKIMAQDSDFDVFVPAAYQLGDVVRNRLYQDLGEFDELKSRIEGNALTKQLAVMGDEIIYVPSDISVTYSGDISTAYSLFKYCYKNLNLYTGEFSDPNGDELFELMKHRCADPEDSKDNPFYDFEFYDASGWYAFMNKYSEKKDLAAEFLCLLFDINCGKYNDDGAIISSLLVTYPEIEDGVEYTPSWLYYTYDYSHVIGEALIGCEETDGSDETLKKLAEDAARTLRMRLEG